MLPWVPGNVYGGQISPNANPDGNEIRVNPGWFALNDLEFRNNGMLTNHGQLMNVDT